jgi:alkanesulfonate monooxygenase SsuD/methylene tetrahydromethanopterin reductase-like flavin-dependent oxidoreductase (luciferase family)
MSFGISLQSSPAASSLGGGISHPADLALIGSAEAVAAGIQRYLDAGATDVRISPAAFATDEERPRTWQLVGELARSAAAKQ